MRILPRGVRLPRASPAPAGRCLLLALLIVLTLTPAGCNIFGVAANALPEPDVAASYKGLAGHTVAVMVWADRGVQIDYPSLRLDVATGVQSKLQQAQKGKKKDLKDARFPYAPASVVRFQEDHPEVHEQPVTQVAPRLKVDRVIYVEIDSLRTRADDAVDLFRGEATASVKVIAVDPQTGASRTAYEESGIAAAFPPSAPPEGIPGVGDARIYRGTVDRLTSLVAIRFFSHPSK
jgi:hypothetical protein